MELSKDAIHRRLIRLRNLERLHAAARKRIVFLESENKQLKARIKELEDKDHDKDKRIEDLSYQFEQIKNKLFGKKPIVNLTVQKKEIKDRDSLSYKRPLPTHITKTEPHPITVCNHCHGKLRNKSIKTFFEEDIPLPIQKIVTKHEVEVGYCPVCKRQSNGYPIPSKKSVLGDNIKKYVCVLSIVNRLSHKQIQDQVKDVFDVRISTGEIGNMLREEANKVRPEYQALKESVLSQTGTHFDETGWKVQKEEQGKYGWVATGTENFDTVFTLGKSRGRGNIKEIGTPKVGISDDYGAYRNEFTEHQLCWAHPQRKLKDLAESGLFGEEKGKQVFNTYEQFSNLYRGITKRFGMSFSWRTKKKVRSVFDHITESHRLDPIPLERIKISLRKNKEKYFTFLDHPHIPIDNNKAERALRHLVIKRKISFGSRTQRGAETTGILASVILSLKWNNPNDWFQKYLHLGT